MFDIGFWELALVGIVALLVLGPERLPETLRTLGRWWGQARRTVSSVQAEIEREIGMDEIRRDLYNESILADARRARDQLKDAVDETRSGVSRFESDLRKQGEALTGSPDAETKEAGDTSTKTENTTPGSPS